MIHGPPTTRRPRKHANDPDRRGVLAPYTALLAVPVALWAASNPLAGVGALAAAVAAHRLARAVVTGARHLAGRGTVTVQLGRVLRVTIAQPGADDASARERCCA